MSEARYVEVGKIVFGYQRMQMHLAAFVDWMSGSTTADLVAHSERAEAYAKTGELFFAGRTDIANGYPRLLQVLDDLNVMRMFIDGIAQHPAADRHLSEVYARSAAASLALADLFDATAYPNAPRR